MTVGIYSRVSKDKKGNDRSIPFQESDGISFAKTNGFNYILYTEKEGTSGTRDDRPEMYKMLNDIKDGKLNAIYAYDLSRLERNDHDKYLIFKTLKDNGAQIYTNRDGLLDFERPEIKLQLDILSATNNYMVSLTKVKVKDTLKKNVSEGRIHSAPPYGYMSDKEKKIKINPITSKNVEKIFELCINGNGSAKIAKTLSDGNIPTPTFHVGGEKLRYRTKNLKSAVVVEKDKLKWNHATVNRILKSPIYKGIRNWVGESFVMPRIVSDDTWNKAQEAIKKNKNNSINNTKHEYLLKGKLFCKCCGNSYHGYTNSKRNIRCYLCYNRRIVNNIRKEKCNNKRIDLFVIEDFIWDRVIGNPLYIEVMEKELNVNDNLPNNLIDDLNITENKLNSLKNASNKLISLLTRDLISEEEFTNQKNELNKEINEYQKKINYLKNKIEMHEKKVEIISEVAKFQNKIKEYENPSFDLKLKLVDLFIDRIVVNSDFKNKLLEINVKFKLNLDIYSLNEELSLDVKKYKNDNLYYINDCSCDSTF